MVLTKLKSAAGWRVCIDGRLTDIYIAKGAAPRYREPQMYDVCDEGDFLFEAKGVEVAMRVIERVLTAAGDQ